MKKIFDLPVCGYDRAKSFYGKAKVIETDNGEKVLQSYNTFVCRITAAGRFVRMWGAYSATTMRHVNSFLSFYDMNGGGVAIVTGYAPFGNIRPSYELRERYETQAEKIRYDYSLSYERQRESLKSLARDFIKGVCNHE